MLNTVYRSFLPVTVLCAVLGFPTVACQRSTLHKLFSVYSRLMTVVLCAVYLFDSVILVYAVQFTYVGFMLTVPGVLLQLVLLHIRVKYISNDEDKTLDNVNYLDTELERLHIKVPSAA